MSKTVPEGFSETKGNAEKLYNQIGGVFCPYLGAPIHFNRKGLDHLRFKSWNRNRPRKDQYVRFKLLHLAPDVLRQSHTLQGIHEAGEFVKVKINSRWQRELKKVEYLEFIAVLKGSRSRVIVKRIEGGDYFFWSLIPYWRHNEYGKVMHEGNPETA